MLEKFDQKQPVRKMKKSLRQSKRMNSRSRMIPRNLQIIWRRNMLIIFEKIYVVSWEIENNGNSDGNDVVDDNDDDY